MTDAEEKDLHSGALSIQLNIVTTVDVAGVLAGRPIGDCVWMTDNGTASTGKGTSSLQTGCRPGQVLNWLIYSLDVEQRPDGSFSGGPHRESGVFRGRSPESSARPGGARTQGLRGA